MKANSSLRTLGLLAAVMLISVASFLTSIWPRSGTARDVAGLAEVYTAAGPDFAAFYTNSFLQQMPFTGPIIWRRTIGRPSVTLTGRVDVVAFNRTMAAQQFKSYHDSGLFFSVNHRAGDQALDSYGSLNPSSGAFCLLTYGLGHKINDFDWERMTNGSAPLSKWLETK